MLATISLSYMDMQRNISKRSKSLQTRPVLQPLFHSPDLAYYFKTQYVTFHRLVLSHKPGCKEVTYQVLILYDRDVCCYVLNYHAISLSYMDLSHIWTYSEIFQNVASRFRRDQCSNHYSIRQMCVAMFRIITLYLSHIWTSLIYGHVAKYFKTQ